MLERLSSNGHYLRPMTFRELSLASNPARAAIALVARGLMALLFTFYVNYLPLHLLTERHLPDTLSSEPSSEHSIQILPKSESVALWIAFLPAVTVVVLDIPESQVTATFVERIWPPKESPPEPSQPRAPPIA